MPAVSASATTLWASLTAPERFFFSLSAIAVVSGSRPSSLTLLSVPVTSGTENSRS